MTHRHYRSIWISDAHLCSRDCRADYLLNFLKHNKSDYLYLVGDIIDVWQLKRRWFWPQALNNFIQKVLKRAKKGTKVVYIPGNHDECLRDFAGAHFANIQIARQALHVTAAGKRLLVIHGDEFDAIVQHNRWVAVLGDTAYGYLIWLNCAVNYMRKKLGMPYWSLSGYIKGRVKKAVRFVSCFEEAVIHYARKSGVDGVVCGHIHQPAIKRLHDIDYFNTGDWIENCTALVEHADGSMALINWAKEWPDLAAEIPDDEETLPLEPVELGEFAI